MDEMTAPESDQVREEAYREAANAVDRFLERVGEPAARLGERGEGAWERFRSEMGRVVDLNLDLVKQAFSMYGSVAGDQPLAMRGSEDGVAMTPSVPGTESGSIVWLHNFEDSTAEAVELIGSALRSDDEEAIDASVWTFDPPSVDVPARTAVPVLVRISVPDTAACRHYRGSITPAGLDVQPIDVTLDVVALEAVPHDSW